MTESTGFGREWRVEQGRAPGLVWRADRYFVRDGVVWPTRAVGGRLYQPAAEVADILTAFAAMPEGDELATLAFVTRYGVLGRVQLLRPGTPRGEPLVWIGAHARTVRVVLELTDRLASIPRQRGTYKVRARESLRAYLKAEVAGQTFAYQARVVRPVWPWLDARVPSDPEDDGRFVRRTLLNANLAGIERRVSRDGTATAFAHRCLLDVLYWHLADVVDGGTVARCASPDCGKVFVRVDARQRFCPGVDGGPSRCAARVRQRRRRA